VIRYITHNRPSTASLDEGRLRRMANEPTTALGAGCQVLGARCWVLRAGRGERVDPGFV
jgi:hypothetical protein